MSTALRARGITLLAIVAVGGILLLGLWLSRSGRKGGAEAQAATQPSALPADTLALPGSLALQPGKRGERDGVGLTRRGDGSRHPPQDGAPDPLLPAVREGLRLAPAAGRQPDRSVENTTADETSNGSTPPTPKEDATRPRTEPPTDAPARYAPFGRPLRCELVFTLESTSEHTPIIALVTEDQWWNGDLIIPAGTEAHGTARVDRSRDRIFSGEEWVLVLPRQEGRAHGRELVVHGLALDRDQPEAGLPAWGQTDGSYGLRGKVLRTTDPEELKLFAATFLGAAASGLQETRSDAFGGRSVLATPANASLEGLRAVLTQVASRIEEEVRRNGSYLQVPAGKQFYLYLTQSLLPDDARVAALAPNATRPPTLRRSRAVPAETAPAARVPGAPAETAPLPDLP